MSGHKFSPFYSPQGVVRFSKTFLLMQLQKKFWEWSVKSINLESLRDFFFFFETSWLNVREGRPLNSLEQQNKGYAEVNNECDKLPLVIAE